MQGLFISAVGFDDSSLNSVFLAGWAILTIRTLKGHTQSLNAIP